MHQPAGAANYPIVPLLTSPDPPPGPPAFRSGNGRRRLSSTLPLPCTFKFTGSSPCPSRIGAG